LHIKKQSFNDCVLCLILEEELPGISCCMFKSAKKNSESGSELLGANGCTKVRAEDASFYVKLIAY